MSLAPAIALLAAGLGGYQKGARMRQLADREAADHAAVVDERTRQGRLRARMTQAAAPVAPQDASVYQPAVDDDGNPMPANPTAGWKAVDGQVIREPDQVEPALREANSFRARMGRVSTAALEEGQPDLAMKLRAGAMQDEAGQLQLDDAKRTHLNKLFEDKLQALDSHDAIAATVSDSGIGGALKLKPVASADGKKIEYHRLNPDGSTTATGYAFTNDGRGVTEAKLAMSRLTPVEQKVQYLFRQAEAARSQDNWQAEQTERKRQADLQAGFERERIDLSRRTVRMAERKAAAELAGTTVPLKDMREFENDVYKRLGPEFDPKLADSDGKGGGRTAAQITAERNAIATRASGIFRFNAQRGMPVTAEVALNAMKLASDRANVREMSGNDGMVYPVVVINGAPVIVGAGQPAGSTPESARQLVESTASRSLQAAKADPGRYAQEFRKAMQLGLSAMRLREMGFAPPQGASPAPDAAAASAAGPSPAPGAAPADPVEQAGQAFEAARSAREVARARYFSFGLRQKAVDPAGFAKAEADYRMAQELEANAQRKYEQLAQQGGAAFRYSAP